MTTSSENLNYLNACKERFAQIESFGSLSASELKSRKQAWDQFLLQGIPETSCEKWKYTNLKPLLSRAFTYPPKTIPSREMDKEIQKKLDKPPKDSQVLVLLNGHLVSNFTHIISTQVQVEAYEVQSAEVLNENIFLRDKECEKQDAFESLNESLFDRGFKLTLCNSPSASQLVYVLHLFSNPGSEAHAFHYKTQIECKPNVNVSLVEEYISLDSGVVFANLNSHLQMQEGAKLDYLKIQNLNKNSLIVDHLNSSLAKDSGFNSCYVTTGSKLTRNNLKSILQKSGSHTKALGLYFVSEDQHVDNHTYIHHQIGNTQSEQLYKGVLNEQARGVFNGLIEIDKGANQTLSSQLNKNLMLSSQAEVDSKPELQVHADDVKANHGSATGELDENEIFYLQSRGISKTQAIQMLSRGYVEEVIYKVESPAIREILFSRLEDLCEQMFKDIYVH